MTKKAKDDKENIKLQIAKNAIDAIRDPIFIHDKDFKVIYANNSYVKVAENSLTDILGQEYWKVFPILEKPLKSCLKALKSKTEEVDVIETSDNEYYRSRSFPVFNTKKDYLYSVHILENITNETKLKLESKEDQDRFKAITNSAQDAVILINSKGKVTFWNKGACNILGYTHEEAIGNELHSLIAPVQYKAKYEKGLSHFFKTGEGSVIGKIQRLEAVRKDCTIIPVELSVSSVKMNNKWHAVGIIRDISVRKEYEDRLLLSQLVIKTAQEAIFISDANGKIIDINPAFTRITGYERDDVIGQNSGVLKSGWHDEDFYQAMWHDILTQGTWEGEIWNRRKNGEVYPEWLSITKVYDDSGTVSQYIAMFTDITSQKESEKILQNQANLDPLTALPNRRCLADRMQQVISFCERDKVKAALLFIDLDHFKEANDKFGHLAGDQLLQEAAERIKSCVRQSDTVARLGGDEFAVLLLKASTKRDVERVVKQILEDLQQPFVLKNGTANVTASIGISFYPDDTKDIDKWLDYADKAMYYVKSTSRNAHKYWQDLVKLKK